jgi:hypothetical protein
MSGSNESETRRLSEWASLTGDRLPEEYESAAPSADR